MHTWQLQNAKAEFSKVIKLAVTQGPQDITVRGEPTAVVISRRDYNKLVKKPHISLVKMLRKSPLVGLNLDLKRNKTTCRNIDL